MSKEAYDIVLDSTNGKAKGILMSHEASGKEKSNPSNSGMGIIKSILLFILAIIIGVALFSLGYLFHKNEQSFSSLSAYKNKFNIGRATNLEINQATQKAQSLYNSFNEQNPNNFSTIKHYVLIGKYKSIDEAKKMQNKIQAKSGKMASIKQTETGVFVFIGPFESESLAKNERALIANKTYIYGSVTNEI